MSDKKCPECKGDTTHVGGSKNEFKTYRCKECGHEFKEPPEPELIPVPFRP